MMIRHRRGLFQRAAVPEVGGNPGCTEAVAAEFGFDPGRSSTPIFTRRAAGAESQARTAG
jgi:hypothetical protein